MVNLRYAFFMKPSGPATIMAPTAWAPEIWLLSKTSMRSGAASSRSTRASPSRLRRWEALSAMAPGEGVARVGAGMLDQFALGAATRMGHLDPAPGGAR